MFTGVTVMAAGDVDLAGSWETFMAAIEGSAGPILKLLGVIGVLVVVLAIVKWAWDRRRGQGGFGGGQSSGAIWGALLVGALLSAPTVVIPLVLEIFDVIANAAIDVFESAKNG